MDVKFASELDFSAEALIAYPGLRPPWSQRCSKSIYKNSETSRNFKISRFQDSSIPRRHYSSCICKLTLCLPRSDSVKNFRNLGFVINLEKSQSGTFSSGPFSRIYCGLKENALSLPDLKIHSISLSAQTLLNRPKVSLRKLSQSTGMCNASRTAVLEAPLHYRSIQSQLTSTLRSQLITHQNYDVKICLNGQSRKDLTWWVKNLKTNCSRPVHPPPVDLSIKSDASDLAWRTHLEYVKIQGFGEVISFLGT